MVNSALESHQAIFLERFKIFIYINKSAQSTVTKWLEFVGSRQVERLELDFLCLSEKHGVELGDLRPMKYLKTMCLRSLKVSGEDISLFLRNCPLLRKLFITKASLTSDVHVSGATLALKHLQIRRRNGRDFNITISAPNLSIVFIDAGRGQLRFENVPKLVVTIFRIRTRITMNNFFSTISCLASQLQSLNLSTSRYEILRKGFPQLSQLKTLIIQDKGKLDHTSLLAATTYVV
ncbi:hypothetical protein SASPL_134478 [Salvia splendens]|uniref:At1g61320/AtMIF1 LRR domain-containing protein n=1 Tax=Salvia splendens TaxID=180675 RepID=A0A8X8X4K8_SALSN|nr:hypothetical protein SASPL_134478 [Salvia splendens]